MTGLIKVKFNKKVDLISNSFSKQINYSQFYSDIIDKIDSFYVVISGKKITDRRVTKQIKKLESKGFSVKFIEEGLFNFKFKVSK